MSNLVHFAFVWEKGYAMIFFSETIVVPDGSLFNWSWSNVQDGRHAHIFSHDDPGLTFTIFMTGSNLFLMLLYG